MMSVPPLVNASASWRQEKYNILKIGLQGRRRAGRRQAQWEDEESQLTISAMAPKARQLAASISQVRCLCT